MHYIYILFILYVKKNNIAHFKDFSMLRKPYFFKNPNPDTKISNPPDSRVRDSKKYIFNIKNC